MSEPSRGGRLPLVFRIWSDLCIAGIVGLIGVRVLHHAANGFPHWIDAWISRAIRFEIWVFIQNVSMTLGPNALIALGVVILLVVRRRWVLGRYDGRSGSRPWLYCLVWTELLLFHCALDMDPRTFWMCVSTLPFLAPAFRSIVGRLGSAWARWLAGSGLPAALLLGWFVGAADPQDRAIVLVWAAVFALLAGIGVRRLWPRDVYLAAVLAIGVTQMTLNILPREWITHRGTPLSDDGYAYTFCEIPQRHKLFVAVPCDRERTDRCGEGYVAEHDTRDLSRRIEHRFFDEGFHGRLVHLACLDDTVQIGMAITTVDGKLQRENVMEFDVDDPSRFRKSLYGGLVGPRVVYDRGADALFYSSEFGKALYHYDRRRDKLTRQVADRIYKRPSLPWSAGSHLVENDAFHDGRGTIFVVQWLSGSKIFEVNRRWLQPIETYDTHNGGNHGIAVDDKLDRMWVTGVWGLDVLEVGSGRTLMRRWLGLGARLPVIDRVHDIVYVPTTAGRLWAFDRRTLATLGSVVLGGGSRNPYISHDGTRLFATTEHGYFYWNTRDLAKTWGPLRNR